MIHEPHSDSLMAFLKATVAERHSRMETLPFITALSRHQLPLGSYIGQLRTMAIIHGTLEHELTQVTASVFRPIQEDHPSRLVHLRKDLAAFDPLYLPDIRPALDAARKIAARIRLDRMEHPTNLIGTLYVLEGTLLGNAVHLPDVLDTFGEQVAGATAYYTGHGAGTADHWRRFSQTMDAFPLDAETRDQLGQVALEVFAELETLFSTLHPVAEHEWCLAATVLNPEAGDHPVPEDRRELEAAVTAASRCRAEFPYFDARFQERGRSFARSDAAWLASLVELSESQVLSQVEWLGRVLGNRGMPRITLERQLELLHEELAAAAPDQRPRYTVLLEAAGSLKRERIQRIPEAAQSTLAKAFDQATNDLLKGTGALIVSAVCDQAAGVTQGVQSLAEWLRDPGRFSQTWIAAVEEAFRQAKQKLSR